MHKGFYGKPLCGKGKIGEEITHSIYVKVTCKDCINKEVV